MKPNYTLELSQSGIRLSAWPRRGGETLGEVSLSDPDFDAKIAEMRNGVAEKSDTPLTTELQIPDSEVLYTTIAPLADDDAQAAGAEAAGTEASDTKAAAEAPGASPNEAPPAGSPSDAGTPETDALAAESTDADAEAAAEAAPARPTGSSVGTATSPQESPRSGPRGKTRPAGATLADEASGGGSNGDAEGVGHADDSTPEATPERPSPARRPSSSAMQMSDVERDVLVRERLEGMTPYTLDDLAYVWKARDDGAIVVAAVARETLAEAEAFGVRRGFNPIRFVARPGKDRFPGTVSFGPTASFQARREAAAAEAAEREAALQAEREAALRAERERARLAPAAPPPDEIAPAPDAPAPDAPGAGLPASDVPGPDLEPIAADRAGDDAAAAAFAVAAKRDAEPASGSRSGRKFASGETTSADPQKGAGARSVSAAPESTAETARQALRPNVAADDPPRPGGDAPPDPGGDVPPARPTLVAAPPAASDGRPRFGFSEPAINEPLPPIDDVAPAPLSFASRRAKAGDPRPRNPQGARDVSPQGPETDGGVTGGEVTDAGVTEGGQVPLRESRLGRLAARFAVSPSTENLSPGLVAPPPPRRRTGPAAGSAGTALPAGAVGVRMPDTPKTILRGSAGKVPRPASVPLPPPTSLSGFSAPRPAPLPRLSSVRTLPDTAAAAASLAPVSDLDPTPDPEPAKPNLGKRPPLDTPKSEAEALTVFGARATARSKGSATPLFVGLLLALLLAFAVWAALFLFGQDDGAQDGTQGAAALVADPIAQTAGVPSTVLTTVSPPGGSNDASRAADQGGVPPAGPIAGGPAAERSTFPTTRSAGWSGATATAGSEAGAEVSAESDTEGAAATTAEPENASIITTTGTVTTTTGSGTVTTTTASGTETTTTAPASAPVSSSAGADTGPQPAPGVEIASLPEAAEPGDAGPGAARPATEDQTVAAANPAAPVAPEAGARPATPTAPEPVSPDPLQRPAIEGGSDAVVSRYATTGVWEQAPEAPEAPTIDRVDDLYIASIDPAISSQDALALPGGPESTAQTLPETSLPPAPAGTTFDLDDSGLVRATPDGSLSPEGVRITAGRPGATPPERPDRPERPAALASTPTPTPTPTPETQPDLPRTRPQARPGDLIEESERPQLGGRLRTEMAQIRSRPRPDDLASRAAAEQSALEQRAAAAADAAAATAQTMEASQSGTGDVPEAAPETVSPALATSGPVSPFAVVRSRLPQKKPGNFDDRVASALAQRVARSQAQARQAPQQEVQVASAASVATPRIPSRASVAGQATVKNAINLGKMNLIGVYGSASNRRALIRLSSGRFVKVKVGDTIDGGRVASIGQSDLSYSKGGRQVTLEMPRG